MNESDTTSFLQLESRTPKETYGAAELPAAPATSSASPGHTCVRWVTVEPALVLTMVSVGLHGPLSTQYLWERISQDLSYNGSETSGCSNDSSDPLQKVVETMTAQWNLCIAVAGFSLSLLMVPLLGTWSDVAGRRPILLLSNVGLALQAVVYLFVMYLKLPMGYFLVGRVLCGLSGDYNVLLAACFSYVADISDRRSRTFRVAILEACLGISGMLSGIIGGEWKSARGVIEPFWLVLACNLASAAYVYWCLGETVLPDPSARLFSFRHYKSIWHLLSTGGLSSNERGRFHRRRLWLYMLCFFIVVTVHISSTDLYVLYELSSPLCWGPTLIGIGSAAQHLAYITSLLGLKLMQHCLVESWMVLVGLVSNISGLLIFSFANTTAVMFTGYAVSLLHMTMTPVFRSKLSQLADPSQQGALFASVGFVKAVCFLVASGVSNSLYAATLHFMNGFTFLCSAILLLIPGGIIGYLQCLEQRRDP
eukprot:XP_003968530.1 PREDICTED: proton-coupled folate transporter-like [Takifugu rubripes]